MNNALPTSLTLPQKLKALANKYYQDAKWTPKEGDYYTTSRADLELYRVVQVTETEVITEYVTRPGVITTWPANEFTTQGFGPKRVHVPGWILGTS